mmetsp:Transcript_96992/g.222188  ORF Transcript_96992/g.222188 Transcript_96992/m.222188 type:complete len:244 (+) Transcript_96992:1493-2224(+)
MRGDTPVTPASWTTSCAAGSSPESRSTGSCVIITSARTAVPVASWDGGSGAGTRGPASSSSLSSTSPPSRMVCTRVTIFVTTFPAASCAARCWAAFRPFSGLGGGASRSGDGLRDGSEGTTLSMVQLVAVSYPGVSALSRSSPGPGDGDRSPNLSSSSSPSASASSRSDPAARSPSSTSPASESSCPALLALSAAWPSSSMGPSSIRILGLVVPIIALAPVDPGHPCCSCQVICESGTCAPQS